MFKIPTIKIPIEAVTTGLDAGLTKAKTKISSFAKATKGIGGGLRGAGDALQGFGRDAVIPLTGSITALTAAMAGIANSTANTGNNIDKMSKAVGIARDQYQELHFAIGQISNLSAQQFDMGLRQINRRMGLAADGNKQMSEAFQKVGVDLDDVRSGAVNAADVFLMAADAMTKLETDAEAAALAQQLFGDDVARLGPILRSSGGDIDALRDRAQELGIVLGDDAIDAAATYTDQMDEVTRQVGALKDAIGAELLPVLVNDLIPIFTDKVLPAIKDIASGIADAIQWFGDLPGPVQEAALAVGAILGTGGPILMAVGVMSKVIGGLIAATGPVGLFIAAAGLLYAAWQKWGDDIQVLISDAVGFISEKFTGLVDFFKGLPEQFRAFGAAIVDGLLEGINAQWEALKTKILELGEMLPEWLRKKLGIASPSRVFATIGQQIGQGLANGMRSMLPEIEAAAGEMTDATTDKVPTALKGLNGAFETAANDMAFNNKKMAESVRDMARDMIKQFIKVYIIKKITGFITGSIGDALGGSGLGNILDAMATFEGGGNTGAGPRSGGLDGRGGRLAVVHPNETIIDHTRPHGGAGAMRGDTYNIHTENNFATGVQATVRAEVMGMMPQITEAAKSAVASARRRGEPV